MEKSFGYNPEIEQKDSGEMKEISDLAIERLAELISDMEKEKAVEVIGHENYERVEKFLERERSEEYARKLAKEKDEKDRLEAIKRNRDDIEELYPR